MTAVIIGTYIEALCLVIGAGFILVGVIGLLKFNDPMTRLHAPTKGGHSRDWHVAACLGDPFI